MKNRINSNEACPACGGQEAHVLEQVRVADIRHEYLRQLGLDVVEEFPDGLACLDWCACAACGLEFFAPLVAGSRDFYSRLARAEGYYTPERWEFGAVAARLSPDPDLIDVGCGEGRFLLRLSGSRRRGLEFNEEAVRRARDAGLEVRQCELATLPPGCADFITLFQVLEHVIDPVALLRDCARVLRPGGRLFVSVPDNEAYPGTAMHDPLNAPPHHILRWKARSLRMAGERAALGFVALTREPLDGRNLYAYWRARLTGMPAGCGLTRLPLFRVGAAMTMVRRFANIGAKLACMVSRAPPQHATGPSLLMEFARHADPDSKVPG